MSKRTRKAAKVASVAGMSDFFTRDKANDGIRLPLYKPDGTATEHWLMVRGVDSDAFREAETDSKRRAMQISQIKDEGECNRAVMEEELRMVAALVIDWSFPAPCTRKEVIEFLRKAPQIEKAVQTVAGRRALFFGNGLSSSTRSPQPPSGSTAAQPDQTKPDGQA